MSVRSPIVRPQSQQNNSWTKTISVQHCKYSPLINGFAGYVKNNFQGAKELGKKLIRDSVIMIDEQPLQSIDDFL